MVDARLYSDRLDAIRAAWPLLGDAGELCVLEAVDLLDLDDVPAEGRLACLVAIWPRLGDEGQRRAVAVAERLAAAVGQPGGIG